MQRLTGGVLILSNKFYIILYRGKDFISGTVAKSIVEREKVLHNQQLQEEEARLKLKNKIVKSEEVLADLGSSWSTLEQAADLELLTEEEKQAFRKIGLKMDGFLLLGRRGIYDGVIGSIHQHWKHREVVKVITMQNSFQQIIYSAKILEIGTGGILVAVEKLRKGHAIIMYRGKNYARPLKLLPENFSTKKQALQRSIEIQRRGSLKFFANQRHQIIEALKQRLRDEERRAKDLISRESKNLNCKF